MLSLCVTLAPLLLDIDSFGSGSPFQGNAGDTLPPATDSALGAASPAHQGWFPPSSQV